MLIHIYHWCEVYILNVYSHKNKQYLEIESVIFWIMVIKDIPEMGTYEQNWNKENATRWRSHIKAIFIRWNDITLALTSKNNSRHWERRKLHYEDLHNL